MQGHSSVLGDLISRSVSEMNRCAPRDLSAVLLGAAHLKLDPKGELAKTLFDAAV